MAIFWAAMVLLGAAWAARLGAHRDVPWLPATLTAAAYLALQRWGAGPEQLAPLLGGALLAGLALTRLDGGRPGGAVVCAFLLLANAQVVAGANLPTDDLPGMPLLPVVLALWAALYASGRRHRGAWLLLGGASLWTVLQHGGPLAAAASAPSDADLFPAVPDVLPVLTVAAFAISRAVYPRAKQAGPAVGALYLGLLLLLTVAVSWAQLRVGLPVAGCLGCCFAALLPAVLDEARTEPDRSFGLDRYFAEAVAISAALGLGWLHGF